MIASTSKRGYIIYWTYGGARGEVYMPLSASREKRSAVALRATIIVCFPVLANVHIRYGLINYYC
jgi:hypothetical protein